MKKLAIVTTHPIQYNAPLFKLLASRKKLSLRVFYTWSQAADTVKDRTFDRDIKWDIPLLEGYDYEFVQNISKKPGSHYFFGIDCPALNTRLKIYAPDAILFFGWNFKSHLRAMRYFHGKVPVWFRGDSTLLDETRSLKTRLRRTVLKMVYKYVDKAFYVGQANKDYFLKHGMRKDQLIYAPHAVNNAHFEDNESHIYEKRAARWKTELGITANQITIVFAGKFEHKKQPDILIDAFIEANKDREVPMVLLVVGSGPLEQMLNEKSKRQDHIRFLPFQNQSKMPLVYRLGSILCLPSKGPGETWGLAMNEAMASSRPVIATDKVGGMEDMLIPEFNGYTFKHDKPSELVAILKNLSLPTLQRMQLNAKAHVELFTIDHIAEALESNLKTK